MLLEEMELDGRDARADPRSRYPSATDVPRRGHRLRRVGAAGRHPAAGGRHPVHDRREERRGRRHLVGEHLPRCRVDVGNHFYCYCFEPTRPLDASSSPSSPSCRRYFERVMDRYGVGRHVRLEDRGAPGGLGRRRRHVVRADPRSQRRDDDADGAGRHLGGRPAQPAEPPRHPGPGHVRRPGLPLGPVGPRGRPDAASGWR